VIILKHNRMHGMKFKDLILTNNNSSISSSSSSSSSSSNTSCIKKKDNAVLVTGIGGPQGFQTSRLPHFLDNRLTDGLMRRPAARLSYPWVANHILELNPLSKLISLGIFVYFFERES
jgi:hypothetical protein